jgi:hypothetical protein
MKTFLLNRSKRRHKTEWLGFESAIPFFVSEDAPPKEREKGDRSATKRPL